MICSDGYDVPYDDAKDAYNDGYLEGYGDGVGDTIGSKLEGEKMMYNNNSSEYRAYIEGRDEGYENGYDDGYESTIDHGYDDELGYRVEEEVKEELKDEKMLWQGYIKRTHNYNGEIVHLWIEGPDFKGDRYAW